MLKYSFKKGFSIFLIITIYRVKCKKKNIFIKQFFKMISSEQSFLSTFKQLSEENKPIKSASPVICTYGLTGSGKSTLINYILKNQLSFMKEKNRYLIDFANPTQVGPKIGNTMNSETRAISCYKWGNIELMDLMGNEDTGGIGIQAYNSWMIRESLKPGSKLSIILVVSVHQLQISRGVKFFQSFGRLEKLLGEEALPMKNSLHLVVSKATSDYEKKDILDTLIETLEVNKHLISKNGYEILKQVIQARVHSFFCPDDSRFDEHIGILMESLSQVNYYQLSKPLNISLSPPTLEALHREQQVVLQDFYRMVTEISNKLQAHVNSIIYQKNTSTNNNTINKLNSIISELSEVEVQTLTKLSQAFNIQINLAQLAENIKNYGLYCVLFNKKNNLSGVKLETTIRQCLQNLKNCNAQIQNEIYQEALRKEQQRREKEQRQRLQRELAQQRRRQEEQRIRRAEQEKRRFEEQKRVHEQNLRRQQQERIEYQRRIQQQRRNRPPPPDDDDDDVCRIF